MNVQDLLASLKSVKLFQTTLCYIFSLYKSLITNLILSSETFHNNLKFAALIFDTDDNRIHNYGPISWLIHWKTYSYPVENLFKQK